MRVRAALTALCLPAAMIGAVATAPTASAAAQCTLTAPSKVYITKPYQSVKCTISGACARADGAASWDGVHPYYGPYLSTYFEGTGTDHEDLYDFDPVGKYTWRGAGAYANDFEQDLSQNTTYTDIRYGSWTSVSTARSGTKVTVKTKVRRYSASTSGKVNYKSASATIQYRGVGAKVWHKLKTVHTDKYGAASYTRSTKSTYQYRVVTSTASKIWGSTSSTSRR